MVIQKREWVVTFKYKDMLLHSHQNVFVKRIGIKVIPNAGKIFMKLHFRFLIYNIDAVPSYCAHC